MNAPGQKKETWRNEQHLHHHYCEDHILQWTAVLTYSGNIPSNDEEDNSVSFVQKARDLVAYFNSSINATGGKNGLNKWMIILQVH
jgi:hypothetical protein